MLGMGELTIILIIVLLLFGAGRLPQVMGDLGKGMKSFREGMRGGDEPEKKNDSKS